MKYLIGRKLRMVELFDVDGNVIPTTVISCEPNCVLDVKNNGTIIVGYNQTNEKKLNKPQLGYFKKLGVKPYNTVMEFNDVTDSYKKGDLIKVDAFKNGELIDIQGITKGHGYTGAIKRWNFKVGPKSHGAGFPHRYQGSVAFGRGGSQGQRIPKGKKMAGHYGHEAITTENIQVIEPITKWNILLVKGAIPGPYNSMLLMKTAIKNPNKITPISIISKEIKEEILAANEGLEDKSALHEANLQAEAEQKAAEAAKAAETAAKAAAAKKEAEANAKANKNQQGGK